MVIFGHMERSRCIYVPVNMSSEFSTQLQIGKLFPFPFCFLKFLSSSSFAVLHFVFFFLSYSLLHVIFASSFFCPLPSSSTSEHVNCRVKGRYNKGITQKGISEKEGEGLRSWMKYENQNLKGCHKSPSKTFS